MKNNIAINNNEIINNAAENGYLEIIKFIKDIGWNISFEQVCKRATISGYLEIIKWSCKYYIVSHIGEDLGLLASKFGHSEMLQWIKESGYRLNSQSIYITATKHDQLQILKWMDANNLLRLSEINEICHHAAVNSQFEILEWCYKKGGNFICTTCNINDFHSNITKFIIDNS